MEWAVFTWCINYLQWQSLSYSLLQLLDPTSREWAKEFTSWWREECLLQLITDSEHGESSYISQVSLSILSAFYDNLSELLLLFWDICRNIWLTSWSFLPKRKATKYCETYLQCRKEEVETFGLDNESILVYLSDQIGLQMTNSSCKVSEW